MPTKTTCESQCESVTEAKLVESSMILESKIRPEFLQIFKLANTVYKNFLADETDFSRKQSSMMKLKMDKLYDKVSNSKNASLNDIVALACSYRILGHIHIRSNEELYLAKNFILRCLNLIKSKELNPQCILLALKSHYQLGIVYHKQGETGKSIETYDKAVNLYWIYTRDKEYIEPINFEYIINKPSKKLNGYKMLRIVCIPILTSLIELHNIMPKDNQKLMIYKHFLLSVECYMLSDSGEYSKWIKEAIILFDYLLELKRFTEARNYLATAEYVRKIILKEIQALLKQQLPKTVLVKSLKKQEDSVHYLLLLHRMMFDVMHLRKSAERLLQLEKNEDPETNNLKPKYLADSEEQISQRLFFFNETDVGGIPNNKPFQYISSYNDAQKIFRRILSFYNDFSNFFLVLDINIYMKVISNTCDAYKYMARYEKDTAGRIALLDRRVNILSDAINITIAQTRNRRYLRLQLAIAYLSLIDVKFESLEAVRPLYMPYKNKAIKNLVENALTNLTKYMLSL